MRRDKIYIFLFLIGFGILIFPHVAQYYHHKLQQAEANEFKQTASKLSEPMISERIEKINKCNELIYENELAWKDPFTNEAIDSSYSDCKNSAKLIGDSFASLEIPKLQLEIPIYIGATENELSKGIGVVEGTSLPIGGENNHTVLAGHRGMGLKAMFRNLDELHVDDLFHIHTVAGKLTYRVYDVIVILPHETERLFIQEGRDLASLITCHPYRANSHRLVVLGERFN